MRFLESGCAERWKASVHGAMGTLALGCAVYNFAAWMLKRRETHLLVNGVFYGTVVAIECKKVNHHLRARR
jgi:hypothetical protein